MTNKNLSLEELLNIPIHDAEFFGFNSHYDETNNVIISIDFRLNDDLFGDEDDATLELISKDRLRLECINCHIYKTIMYVHHNLDSIDELNHLQTSDLLGSVTNKINLNRLFHIEIKFHSGSKLDIIAERFSLHSE